MEGRQGKGNKGTETKSAKNNLGLGKLMGHPTDMSLAMGGVS